ncbi:MAG: hypothetical protein AMXMBFR53_31160 [Gemmatimonadota bacterium]
MSAQAQQNSGELRVQLSLGGDDWERRDEYIGSVLDAKLLAGGGVVFLDGQALELRAFDSEGRPLYRVGREGRGPEEWSRHLAGLVVLPGDTVVVADPGNAKLALVGPEGGLSRTYRFATPYYGRNWRLVNDTLLLYDTRTRPETLRLLRLGQADPTVLYSFPYEAAPVSRGQTPLAPLLSTEGRWTAVGGVLVTAVSTAPVLQTMSISAGHQRAGLIKLPREAGRVSASDRRRLEALWRERLPMGRIPRSMWDQIELVYPDSLPIMGQLAAGPNETVWVQRPAAVSEMSPSDLMGPPLGGVGSEVWDVYSLTGAYVGAVGFPARLRVLDSKGVNLLTLRRDELGREVLEVWAWSGTRQERDNGQRSVRAAAG